MKAMIYTRVATKRQAQRSGPSRQEDACRAYCARKGWEILGVWHEVGSAGDGWRLLPILSDLVTVVIPREQPVVLVAEDYGRFTQAGVADGEDFAEAVQRGGGRVASPELEDPEIVRQAMEFHVPFLESQRKRDDRDDKDEEDKEEKGTSGDDPGK